MIVVGNKVDMASTDRAVSYEEGSALAEEFGASFIEVSAKDNLQVKDAFVTLVRQIVVKKPDAGRNEGAGNVFGAGSAAAEAEPEPEEIRPQKAASLGAPRKPEVEEKKTKKKCLIL
jgi:hypothetical protein